MGDLGKILRKPSDDVLAKIEKELGVDADMLTNNVQLIEEWIRGQRHLPQDCDSQIIENFLRMTKNNVEKAKMKIEASVISRSKFRDIYEDRTIDDDTYAKSMAYTNFCVPPGHTKDGYRIVIMRTIDRNTDHGDMKEAVKFVAMIGDLQICRDIMAGYIVIIDLCNITPSHLKKLNPFDLKKAIYLIQYAYPARLKQIHLINANSLTESVVAIAKPFLKQKLRKRIMVHKNVENLAKFVPIDMLPKDYGGKENTSMEICEVWRQFFAQNTEWSRKIDRMKLVDDIPKHKAEFYSFDEFSMEGSFRRLSID